MNTNLKLSYYKLHINRYSLLPIRYCLLTIAYSLLTVLANAQDGTRNPAQEAFIPSGKIMIIPFEPKLYMREIDQKINQQTKWNFNQIRENFRHQLDHRYTNRTIHLDHRSHRSRHCNPGFFHNI